MSRSLFYYLLPLCLIAAALLQSTALTKLELSNVKPDLVLLFVLIGTMLYGSRSGVSWAFLGGIALDLFSGGPMGTSSIALIAASLVASVGYSTVSRFNLFVPIVIAALGTIVYSLVYLWILALLGTFMIWEHNLPIWPAVQFIVAPAVLYNTGLMVTAMPFLNRVPAVENRL